MILCYTEAMTLDRLQTDRQYSSTHTEFTQIRLSVNRNK